MLACAATTPGCLAAPLHTVEVADPGHLTAAVSGQIGGALQGEMQLAYGIAPHVQIEASGVAGASADGVGYSGGAGIRGQIPLLASRADGSSPLSLQIAGLYRHSVLPGDDENDCDPESIFDSCLPSATIDTMSAELGLVGRALSSPIGLSWGVWAAGGGGNASGTVCGGCGPSGPGGYVPYRSTIALLTLSASVEISFDRTRTWNLLLGVTWQSVPVPDQSSPQVNPEPDAAWGFGAGLVARF